MQGIDATVAASPYPCKVQLQGSKVRLKRQSTKGQLRKGPSESFVSQTKRNREQLKKRNLASVLFLRPGESPFLVKWDAATVIVLTYTALYTPFDLAFNTTEVDLAYAASPRFIIARLVDFYFLLDFVLQFFIAFRATNPVEDGHLQGRWVEQHSLIARNYLKTWMIFDLATLVPSVFDIIPLVNSDAGNFRDASIARVFRVLRFVKILRVMRAARVMQRLASRITLQHSSKVLVWCIVRLLIAVHWFACVIALQASLHGSAQDTWMGEDYYGYCHTSQPFETFLMDRRAALVNHSNYSSILADDGDGGQTNISGASKVGASKVGAMALDFEYDWCPGLSAGEWYAASFSWSLMIITGTGGTDFYPSAKSTPETVVVLSLIFIGAILWTQILADFCDVASNGDPAGVRFRQLLDELNSFCSLHYIPHDMAIRMREYLHAQRFCQMRFETGKSLFALSPTLRVEVTVYMYARLFEKIWYLKLVDQTVATNIAMRFTSNVMAPGELASLRTLYVIERGMILYRGAVLTHGRLWGHDDVLLTDGLLQYELRERGQSLSYVETRELLRGDLHDAVAADPDSWWLLRKLAVYLAFRRFLVAAARVETVRSGKLSLTEFSENVQNGDHLNQSPPASLGGDDFLQRMRIIDRVNNPKLRARHAALDHAAPLRRDGMSPHGMRSASNGASAGLDPAGSPPTSTARASLSYTTCSEQEGQLDNMGHRLTKLAFAVEQLSSQHGHKLDSLAEAVISVAKGQEVLTRLVEGLHRSPTFTTNPDRQDSTPPLRGVSFAAQGASVAMPKEGYVENVENDERPHLTLRDLSLGCLHKSSSSHGSSMPQAVPGQRRSRLGSRSDDTPCPSSEYCSPPEHPSDTPSAERRQLRAVCATADTRRHVSVTKVKKIRVLAGPL